MDINNCKPLTIERLREVLDYNHETGDFTWKVRSRLCVKAGSIAGFCDRGGYRYIRVDYYKYLAHRLAWFYIHGEWPSMLLDHLNGIRSDNRMVNLRLSNKTTNSENRRVAAKTNKSGFLGVATLLNGKFRAAIWVKGKCTYLGNFSTPQEAHNVYLIAKRKLHEGCTI